MSLSGGCRCGACRYELDFAEHPLSYACHCLECQTVTGGAVAVQMMVPGSRLHVTGKLDTWERPNARGIITTHYLCAACKTRLYSINAGRAQLALLRAGTLDDSDGLTPAFHMWLRRKQPWIEIAGDPETYYEGPPGERMAEVFAPNLI